MCRLRQRDADACSRDAQQSDLAARIRLELLNVRMPCPAIRPTIQDDESVHPNLLPQEPRNKVDHELVMREDEELPAQLVIHASFDPLDDAIKFCSRGLREEGHQASPRDIELAGSLFRHRTSVAHGLRTALRPCLRSGPAHVARAALMVNCRPLSVFPRFSGPGLRGRLGGIQLSPLLPRFPFLHLLLPSRHHPQHLRRFS
mmetsp:Transcript_13537/g.50375  ORF Transcript_13537/g.50375 Transcript_13537/m.50375 type:complete len:202 (+) Transcript_13537:1232-1837(+)